jgi:PPE family
MASASLAPIPSPAVEIRSESAALIAATVSSLTGVWQAPFALAMTQAAEPYLTWLRTTAQQAQQTAASAQAAAAAFSASARLWFLSRRSTPTGRAGAVVGHQNIRATKSCWVNRGGGT